MEFRIWSFEHDAWWKANWRGYTKDMKKAGLYSLKSAVEICKGANRFVEVTNEAMVPVDD